MKKFLFCVTATGVDDSTQPDEVVSVHQKHPFAEWGFLLSESHQGVGRYISPFMASEYTLAGVNYAVHVCGKWSRAAAKGDWTWADPWWGFIKNSNRIQLNGVGTENLDLDAFLLSYERAFENGKWFILQNDRLAVQTLCDHDVYATVLFDESGGLGIKPAAWQPSYGQCGYAGGLNAKTLKSDLQAIARAAGINNCWIDAESSLRVNDKFSTYVAEQYLQQAQGFVLDQT